jgi:hypothetical protein
MTIDDFVDHLQEVTRTERGYRALCPGHDDHTPSLDIDEGDDGRILLCCRSRGCSAASIVAAIDLELRHLFPDRQRPSWR